MAQELLRMLSQGASSLPRMNRSLKIFQKKRYVAVLLLLTIILLIYTDNTTVKYKEVVFSRGDNGEARGIQTDDMPGPLRDVAGAYGRQEPSSHPSYSEVLSGPRNIKKQYIGNKLGDGPSVKETNENRESNFAINILSKNKQLKGSENESNDIHMGNNTERLKNLSRINEIENLDHEETHIEEKEGEVYQVMEPLSAVPTATIVPHKKTINKSLSFDRAQGSSPQKTVLFYDRFFYNPWQPFVEKMTKLKGKNCPVTNCVFIYNSSHPEDADAVIFHAADFNPKNVPKIRKPQQRYIWLNLESPSGKNLTNSQSMQNLIDERWFSKEGFFNWSYTYHRDSDLLLLYGGLESLRGERDPTRPGLIDISGPTYKDYITALDGGDQLMDDPNHDWPSFFTRPKMLIWMVSHCSTHSGREFYVKKLQEYLPVDVYGLCGDLRCDKNNKDLCYADVLRPKYKFYLSFENNMCDDYITEKVWLPMNYGLVPVVFGGANYSRFLPPHSYLDATQMTPAQLATSLIRINSSSQEYGRYHLWRRYWQVLQHLPMCELCQKLHEDKTSTAIQHLGPWWRTVNKCWTQYPEHSYPRRPEPDTRTFTQKLTESVHLIGSLFSGAMNSLQ
ncbi:alpha-(1,3)-fucosyltransferase C-like [Homarus americanus]|uniref:Fucosyltransferase n=1 Tax=Homarus americanus TaxID=6706 RepID=A0A8J5JP68_HOMAM|nr:alpha-(1,3)-fucosyltransferase C-like [Homarus americanus]KAG7158173.1 Alpha-(1 3)-fucosyltransferase C-like 5 [Homarus americanus]